MIEKCENCRFWWGTEEGSCRRKPPVIVDYLIADGPSKFGSIENIRWATCYPETDGEDWCGEYQRRLNDE